MTHRDRQIVKIAWIIATNDPEQSGNINDSEMGIYFWEKHRDYYIEIATAVFDNMLHDIPEWIK